MEDQHLDQIGGHHTTGIGAVVMEFIQGAKKDSEKFGTMPPKSTAVIFEKCLDDSFPVKERYGILDIPGVPEVVFLWDYEIETVLGNISEEKGNWGNSVILIMKSGADEYNKERVSAISWRLLELINIRISERHNEAQKIIDDAPSVKTIGAIQNEVELDTHVENANNGGFPWIAVVTAGAVIVAGAGVGAYVYKKKKFTA